MRPFRIAAVVVQSALLAFAGPANVTGHVSGGSAYWEGWNLNGYSYWVNVCDTNMSGASESRLIDAAGEWSEIGGELKFNWTGWSGVICNQNWGNQANQVRVDYGPLGGDVLGEAFVNLIFGQVDQVDITIDNDGSLSTWGTYSWYTGTGSPSSTQVDLESVLVHELGHALAALGHSTENEVYIMDNSLGDPGSPKGVEKDERVYFHDSALYTDLYGTTH